MGVGLQRQQEKQASKKRPSIFRVRSIWFKLCSCCPLISVAAHCHTWKGICNTLNRHNTSNMAKKKGFMTPERKKKLRTLLRKKAAEELKKEQERKAAERQRVISER